MPTSPWAERAAGLEPTEVFANSAPLAHPHLLWLGDVLPVPLPLGLSNVLSAGDLLIYAGALVLVQRTCVRGPTWGMPGRVPEPLPFERPLGATPDGIRVWAPKAAARRGAAGRRRPRARARGARGVDAARRRGRRRRLRLVLDGTRLPDPCSRCAAGGPARAVAGRRPGALGVDRRGLEGRALRGPGPLRAARRHVHAPRARSTARSAHLRGAARARRHRIELMPVADVPGRARLGLRRRLPVGRARPPTAGPTASQRLVDAAHAAGIAVILDVVHNHVGASGDEGAARVRPVLHRPLRDVLGRGDQLRRRRLAAPCASGCSRAPRCGSRDLHVDGLRLDAIHAIFDTSARARRRRAARPRARGRPARARDRRVAASTTRRSIRPASGRLGLRRRSGPTTSTTRCARSSPTSARATTPSSAASRDLAKAFAPPVRARRRLLDVPPAALRRAGRRTGRPSSSSSSTRTTTRSATARSATGSPAEALRARRVLHAAVAVHADAVHGRGVRRARAVSVLHRPHRRAHRRGHARGAPARVRRVRRVRRRGDPRPAGPGDVRALEAHRARARRGARAARTRRCCARARELPPGERDAEALRRATRAGCACAAATSSCSMNFGRAQARARGRQRASC